MSKPGFKESACDIHFLIHHLQGQYTVDSTHCGQYTLCNITNCSPFLPECTQYCMVYIPLPACRATNVCVWTYWYIPYILHRIYSQRGSDKCMCNVQAYIFLLQYSHIYAYVHIYIRIYIYIYIYTLYSIYWHRYELHFNTCNHAIISCYDAWCCACVIVLREEYKAHAHIFTILHMNLMMAHLVFNVYKTRFSLCMNLCIGELMHVYIYIYIMCTCISCSRDAHECI